VKYKFDPTKAWKLVAVCLAAIFEADRPYRAKVILLKHSTTKVNQKAVFMWAIFQTHHVIQSWEGQRAKPLQSLVENKDEDR
jgi:hypothetical protein